MREQFALQRGHLEATNGPGVSWFAEGMPCFRLPFVFGWTRRRSRLRGARVGMAGSQHLIGSICLSGAWVTWASISVLIVRHQCDVIRTSKTRAQS